MFKIIVSALGILASTITPAFRQYVKEQLPVWEAKAAETKGKGDDLIVTVLRGIFP